MHPAWAKIGIFAQTTRWASINPRKRGNFFCGVGPGIRWRKDWPSVFRVLQHRAVAAPQINLSEAFLLRLAEARHERLFPRKVQILRGLRAECAGERHPASIKFCVRVCHLFVAGLANGFFLAFFCISAQRRCMVNLFRWSTAKKTLCFSNCGDPPFVPEQGQQTMVAKTCTPSARIGDPQLFS